MALSDVNDALKSTGHKATGIDLMSCYMLKDENNKKLVYARLKTISEFTTGLVEVAISPLPSKRQSHSSLKRKIALPKIWQHKNHCSPTSDLKSI